MEEGEKKESGSGDGKVFPFVMLENRGKEAPQLHLLNKPFLLSLEELSMSSQ